MEFSDEVPFRFTGTIDKLVLSIYDAKQKALIWRGIAQNTLSNNGNKPGSSRKSGREDVQAVAEVLSGRSAAGLSAYDHPHLGSAWE